MWLLQAAEAVLDWCLSDKTICEIFTEKTFELLGDLQSLLFDLKFEYRYSKCIVRVIVDFKSDFVDVISV